MPEQADELFVRFCVEKGWLTPGQVETAREDLGVLRERGINETLPQILTDKGLLSSAQCQEAVQSTQAQPVGVQRIAGYELVQQLGSGWTGAVYKARALDTGDVVALKVLTPQMAKDLQYLARFQRETRILQTLKHRNIVGCLEVGYDEQRGVHYCAMEFVGGERLDARIKRRGTINEQEALTITCQVAEALQHAKFNGLMHRDIKPANIMLTPEGTAKLLDMGLARDVVSSGEAQVTSDGVFIGSPNYCSPEQAKGERNLDSRTDIYSLGATLYHMVTGQVPFESASPAETVGRRLTEQLPWPADVNPRASENTGLLIEKMMAREPADRYSSPKDLLADLIAVMDGRPPSALRPADSSIAGKRDASYQKKTREKRGRRPASRAGARPGTRGRQKPVAGPSHKALYIAAAVIALVAVVFLVFSFPSSENAGPAAGGKTGTSLSPSSYPLPSTPSSPQTDLPAPTPTPPPSPTSSPRPFPESPAHTATGKSHRILVDFEHPINMTSKYGHPVIVTDEAARSGRAGLKITMAPGMSTHQAARVEIDLPEPVDFTRAANVELYVRAQGSGGNRGEFNVVSAAGEYLQIPDTHGGWIFDYRDGAWQRLSLSIPDLPELKSVRKIAVYFNHVSKEGPFSFCVDDIALTGYGERRPPPTVSKPTRTTDFTAPPALSAGMPKKRALTSAGKVVLFAANFEAGTDGFYGGERVTGNAFGGSTGALKALYDSSNQYFSAALRAEVFVYTIQHSDGLFRLERDTKIRFAYYVDGSDFVHVQFWDADRGGNYYVRIDGAPQRRWTVAEADPFQAKPNAQDGSTPQPGDRIRTLNFYAGIAGRPITFHIDEVCVTGSARAETAPTARPQTTPDLPTAKGIPRRLLAELSTLVQNGDYQGARNLARENNLASAARVFDALCEREETLRSAARAFTGKDAAFDTRRGTLKGRVAAVGENGIEIVSVRKIRGMGTAEMRFTIPWADLTPEAEDKLATDWSPEGADGAIAAALIALRRGDQETAKQQLDAAPDHPLAPLIRAQLGIPETPEPDKATPPAPAMEPGWTTVLDGTSAAGWKLIGPGARLEKSILMGDGQAEFHYPAQWEEFILDCEIKSETRTPIHFLSISLNQWDMMGTSSRARLTFFGDGDAHLKIGTAAAAVWRAGSGKFSIADWTRVRLEIRRDTLTISKDGTELGRVDMPGIPLRKGGVAFFTKAGCTVQIRNIRVRLLSP